MRTLLLRTSALALAIAVVVCGCGRIVAPPAAAPAAAPPVAAQVADAREWTVRGRVTDQRTGRAIQGAEVRVTLPEDTVRTTATDADGRFAIEGVPAPARIDDGDGPPSAAAVLRVAADGYVAFAAELRDDSAREVALETAAALTGRVLDGDGRPVAGAGVHLERRSSVRNAPAGRPPEWETTPTARTDVDGRFRVATRARYRHVRVSAVGFAPLHRALEREESQADPADVGDLVLGPGILLEGLVFDGEGRPMPGVHVRVDEQRCETDAAGAYCVRDLAPGRHVLRAFTDGRDQLERAIVLADGGAVAARDLAFPAGREVTIEVRDAAGAPVGNAALDVVGRRIWEHTDTDGRCVVVLPPGEWKVRVGAGRERHADGRRTLAPRTAVIPEDATELRVMLDRTPAPEELRPVGGSVIDEAGQPVGGVVVVVTWEGEGDPAQRTERARSDEGGRFAVRVPTGVVCDVRADTRIRTGGPPMKGLDLAPWCGAVTDVAAGRTDVVLVARPEPRDRAVRVVVLSADGAPVAGAPVRLQGALQDSARAETDEEGRVELSALAHRACSISVDPPQSRRAEWLTGHSPEFVPDGQELVVRLPRAAEVSGTVLLADGSPASEAYVNGERVDRAGRFRLRIDADAPLPWRLTATQNSDWPRTVIVVELTAPPSTDVTLRFPEPKLR